MRSLKTPRQRYSIFLSKRMGKDGSRVSWNHRSPIIEEIYQYPSAPVPVYRDYSIRTTRLPLSWHVQTSLPLRVNTTPPAAGQNSPYSD